MSIVPTIRLNNGVTSPVFGLGTYQGPLGREQEVGQAIKDAIDLGYRHFDCAHFYKNEDIIGAAIAEKINSGVVTRNELFIVTKLWNTHHRPEAVEPMLRVQLKNLKLDYVDLYLMHWPMGYKEGEDLYPTDPVTSKPIHTDINFIDTWLAMEELQRKGLTRSIGISNFNSHQIEKLLKKATIVPVTNQVECHPYLNQNKLRNYCLQHGIVLTSYCPLGGPSEQKPEGINVLDDPKIKEIAKKYGKTPAQILLRFNVQLGNIVIPKSSKKERLHENINIFDFELTEEDMEYIQKFDCGVRVIKFEKDAEHLYYPFQAHIEF